MQHATQCITFRLIKQALGGELSAERKAAWAAWVADWRRQLQADGQSDGERQAAQNAVNPMYIPRNHVMQTAIAAAEKGNSTEVPPANYESSDVYVDLKKGRMLTEPGSFAQVLQCSIDEWADSAGTCC